MFRHLLTPILFFLPRLSKRLSDRHIVSFSAAAGWGPLPRLRGSARQLPWAERLRDQFIRSAAPRGTAVVVLAQFHNENNQFRLWIEGHPKAALGLARACIRSVARNPYAWFWIDARPIDHISLISAELVDRLNFWEVW